MGWPGLLDQPEPQTNGLLSWPPMPQQENNVPAQVRQFGWLPQIAHPVNAPVGLVTPGNITNLESRPNVRNPDGSVSTVRSMSFGTDQGEVLVPTVSEDGRIMSEQEAMDTYQKTGRHLGIFQSPDHASAYARALHNAQDAFYQLQPPRRGQPGGSR
jgi:hypothetical protein